MHTIGYCRVSTTEQATEGVSLDAQRERIRLWAAMRGATFDPADLHVDAGISGKRSDNRPGLQAALDAACKPGGILVVYSLSRLARSVKDTLAIAERIEKAGADLVSLSEQLDTTSASGKMIFRLLAVMAEFERDLISERTRTGFNYKRSRNERLGQIPYGSKLDPDGRTLVEHDGERRVLGTIREMEAGGMTPRAIAVELSRRGVPTKSGGPTWAHTTVKRIIERGKRDGEKRAGGVGRPEPAHPELSAP